MRCRVHHYFWTAFVLAAGLCLLGCEPEDTPAQISPQSQPTAIAEGDDDAPRPLDPAEVNTPEPAEAQRDDSPADVQPNPADDVPPAPAPVEQRDEPQDGPKIVVSDTPAPAPPGSPSGETTTAPADQARVTPLSKEQLDIFDALQQRILKLMYDMEQKEQKIQRLTEALIESRENASESHSQLTRMKLQQQIQALEIRDLQDQLADAAETKQTDTSPQAGPIDLTTSAPAAGSLEAMETIRKLQRQNQALELRLKLATMDLPEQNQDLLKRLTEAENQLGQQKQHNAELSHLTVRQAEEIRRLRERFTQLARQLAARNQPESTPAAPATPRPQEQPRPTETPVATVRLGETATTKPINQESPASSPETESPDPDGVDSPEPAPAPVAIADAGGTPAADTQSEESRSQASVPLSDDSQQQADVPPSESATSSPQASEPDESVQASPTAPQEGTANTPSPATQPDGPITGQIQTLREVLVTLNIGRAEGLSRGMRLIVFRDDQFVGYLQVDHVEEHTASGTITRKVLEPKVGDFVIDRLN